MTKNKLFLSKKAQTNEIYYILIQILIALVIYWALQSYVDSVAKDTLFEKSYLSKDIALLVNAIYSAPEEIRYIYTNEKVAINKFEFDFSQQTVIVSEIDAKVNIETKQPYGEDLSYPLLRHRLYNTNQIAFYKNENNLEVTQNER